MIFTLLIKFYMYNMVLTLSTILYSRYLELINLV